MQYWLLRIQIQVDVSNASNPPNEEPWELISKYKIKHERWLSNI